jgi:hypothetical protein
VLTTVALIGVATAACARPSHHRETGRPGASPTRYPDGS